MRRSVPVEIILALCGWFGAAIAGPVFAASPPAKQTFMVPMRDGIYLATDIYRPVGDGPWPVALVRTPYGKDGYGSYLASAGSLFPAAQFAQNGIVLVIQDTRGRSASEGKARPFLDDGWGDRQGGLDTMAWLRQQTWYNGKSWPTDQNYPSVVAHQTIFLGGADGSSIVLPQVVEAAGP